MHSYLAAVGDNDVWTVKALWSFLHCVTVIRSAGFVSKLRVATEILKKARKVQIKQKNLLILCVCMQDFKPPSTCMTTGRTCLSVWVPVTTTHLCAPLKVTKQHIVDRSPTRSLSTRSNSPQQCERLRLLTFEFSCDSRAAALQLHIYKNSKKKLKRTTAIQNKNPTLLNFFPPFCVKQAHPVTFFIRWRQAWSRGAQQKGTKTVGEWPNVQNWGS